jgi:hypothetical protein
LRNMRQIFLAVTLIGILFYVARADELLGDPLDALAQQYIEADLSADVKEVEEFAAEYDTHDEYMAEVADETGINSDFTFDLEEADDAEEESDDEELGADQNIQIGIFAAVTRLVPGVTLASYQGWTYCALATHGLWGVGDFANGFGNCEIQRVGPANWRLRTQLGPNAQRIRCQVICMRTTSLDPTSDTAIVLDTRPGKGTFSRFIGPYPQIDYCALSRKYFSGIDDTGNDAAGCDTSMTNQGWFLYTTNLGRTDLVSCGANCWRTRANIRTSRYQNNRRNIGSTITPIGRHRFCALSMDYMSGVDDNQSDGGLCRVYRTGGAQGQWFLANTLFGRVNQNRCGCNCWDLAGENQGSGDTEEGSSSDE